MTRPHNVHMQNTSDTPHARTAVECCAKEAARSPRIAFFLASRWGGGAERVVVSLANSLSSDMHVDLILLQVTDEYKTAVSPEVNLVDLNSRGAMASIPALVAYLRRSRPDAVLSTLEQANIAMILAARIARTGVRVVIREASTVSRVVKCSKSLRRRLIPRLMPYLYPLADRIVAVSDGVASDLAGTIRIARDKIQVINNPVDSQELARKAGSPIDHPWFGEGLPPVVLGVGSLNEAKDFGNLITAFGGVRKKVDAKLVILGEGEERQALEELVTELGLQDAVSLPGFVNNPYPFLLNAGVFVLSSRYEGSPNVLIEAKTLGVPLVATDCESGPREILESGKHGRLVPVGDASTLSGAIIEALGERSSDSPLRQMRPDERFELDIIKRQYCDAMLR